MGTEGNGGTGFLRCTVLDHRRTHNAPWPATDRPPTAPPQLLMRDYASESAGLDPSSGSYRRSSLVIRRRTVRSTDRDRVTLVGGGGVSAGRGSRLRSFIKCPYYGNPAAAEHQPTDSWAGERIVGTTSVSFFRVVELFNAVRPISSLTSSRRRRHCTTTEERRSGETEARGGTAEVLRAAAGWSTSVTSRVGPRSSDDRRSSQLTRPQTGGRDRKRSLARFTLRPNDGATCTSTRTTSGRKRETSRKYSRGRHRRLDGR